ncbi:DUF1761 domain-containing protein [Pseudolysinimonas yzui]|uniref:DUF1761 domain-containing protein n=1 Tax=Pseudolysinimonas yzui TaxID=2708254 RepID=A0A8J3LYG5_9MICO|nr:DUF1761 domain-containing protein [Pseudolysinimonas yzui]GHF05742.1 hypothetical protein GCM10011600_02860 [Pseudolysinimonas yzui]
MFNVLTEINWLAVLAAVVASGVIGGVWFGVVVAKPYLVALGRQNEPAAKPGALTYTGPMVAGAVIIVTSAVLLRALGVETLSDGILFGLLVGVGYLVSMTFTIAINPNFPRPVFYTLLNAPSFLLTSVVTSIILTLWR